MKKGNWVALDKAIRAALPTTRPYTLIEALFSYQLDIDQDALKSLNDYARIWSWSRTKVTRFIRENESIPVDTPKAAQRLIKFRFIEKLADMEDRTETTKTETERRPNKDRTETTQRPNNLFNDRELGDMEDRTETEQKPNRDRTETVYYNPNPNPNPKNKEYTPEYFAYFDILKTIPGYPVDLETDFAFLQEKEKDFPKVDILSLLKAWRTYLLDKPLKKKSRPRSQLLRQFELAIEWNRHQKPAVATAGAGPEDPGENMLDRINAALEEDKAGEEANELHT